ncbi:MAG TPA: hypothetical protein VFG51_02755 [Candidatus Saccharimonadia bacterium]|nr:hypothetical protein [Candidatus Saccharimonadia bacterium]
MKSVDQEKQKQNLSAHETEEPQIKLVSEYLNRTVRPILLKLKQNMQRNGIRTDLEEYDGVHLPHIQVLEQGLALFGDETTYISPRAGDSYEVRPDYHWSADDEVFALRSIIAVRVDAEGYVFVQAGSEAGTNIFRSQSLGNIRDTRTQGKIEEELRRILNSHSHYASRELHRRDDR